MKKILTALFLCSAALLPLSAQKNNTPVLEKLAENIPHYANTSVGVMDVEKFDTRSFIFRELLDFMDTDDIFKDLNLSANDVRAIASGKEDQRHGDAQYAVILLKKQDAKNLMEKLAARRGSRQMGTRVIFDEGEKFAEAIAPDRIFFTEMDHALQNAPRTLELRRNMLAGTFPAEKDGLAVQFARNSKGVKMILTVKKIVGKIPCYELKAAFYGNDVQQIKGIIDRNIKDELLDEGMADVAKRLLIQTDPANKCVAVTAQIAAWRNVEFKALLETLEIDD